MRISWLDEKASGIVGIDQSMPLYKRFRSYTAEKGFYPFNIVCTDKKIAGKVITAMKKLDFSFPTLNLRFGWIDKEEKDVNSGTLDFDNALIIGEDKDIKPHLLEPNVKLLHISSTSKGNVVHLAYQRHISSKVSANSISLGEMREDLSDSETLVRSCDRIHMHLDALRYEDSQSKHSPIAGLDIYRTCKLMRLAGMSKRVKMLCINTVENKITPKTAELISTMIWYFLEGQINKEIETMKQKENDIFLVNSNMFEEPIKFVVGHTTGRWWYQHPSSKQYLPCSDKDYKAISMGNLPEAIVSLQD